MGYKSRQHLLRGTEGIVRQATQREATLSKKKKKTVKVRRRFEKLKEINQWSRDGERREEVEEELEWDDPMESGKDVGSSKDEGDEGATTIMVERRTPVAAPVGGGNGTETHGDAPESRKPPTNGRRSGCGRRALWRHGCLRGPLI